MKIYARARTVFALAFFCLSVSVTPAFAKVTQKSTTQHQATAHPSIQVQDPEYNFGTVVQGGTVEHAFTVKNTGKEVLKIEQVKVG